MLLFQSFGSEHVLHSGSFGLGKGREGKTFPFPTLMICVLEGYLHPKYHHKTIVLRCAYGMHHGYLVDFNGKHPSNDHGSTSIPLNVVQMYHLNLFLELLRAISVLLRAISKGYSIQNTNNSSTS